MEKENLTNQGSNFEQPIVNGSSFAPKEIKSVSWDFVNDTDESFNAYIKWYKKELLKLNVYDMKNGHLLRGIKRYLINTFLPNKYINNFKKLRTKGAV